MSHRVRIRCPVSGLVWIEALWVKKDVALCHPVSCPRHPVRWVGCTAVSFLQATKVQSKLPLPLRSVSSAVLTMTTLFPIAHPPAKLRFLQIVLFPGFWDNIRGNALKVRGRKLWHFSCTDVVFGSHYLPFLISFHFLPPYFSHLSSGVIVKLPHLPHRVALHLIKQHTWEYPAKVN